MVVFLQDEIPSDCTGWPIRGFFLGRPFRIPARSDFRRLRILIVFRLL